MFDQKQLFKQSKFSSEFPLFIHGKKNKLSEYIMFVSEIVTYMSKMKSSL